MPLRTPGETTGNKTGGRGWGPEEASGVSHRPVLAALAYPITASTGTHIPFR